MTVLPYVKMARPEQWVKNGFVMAGFLFAGNFSDYSLFATCLFAAAIFCIASSSIYSMNDAVDADKDRLHPVKKNRPVASNRVSSGSAFLFSAALALLSLFSAAWIGKKMFAIVLLFLLLNAAYSLYLKRVVIVDVFCIAFGFILRMLAGTYSVGIPPSRWIVICTMMLSLFLGFSKRYAELSSSEGIKGRAVLENYSAPVLRLFLSVSASCTILSYGLYTISPRTLESHSNGLMIYSLPIVIYGLFRYLYLVLSGQKGENPSRELLSDPHLLATTVLYLLFILWVT